MIVFPSPTMAEVGDGAVHGVNPSWLDHARERAGTASLHCLEQLIAAIKDRASDRREHEHINTSGYHWHRPLVQFLDIHSLLVDRSTASLCSSGSFQAVLTLGQHTEFDLSDINPAKMVPTVGMQECANRIADKETCVLCAVKFNLKTLRKFFLIRRFRRSTASKIKMVRSVFATKCFLRSLKNPPR